METISLRRSRAIPRAAASPLGDRILIRVDDALNKSAGGLFLGKEGDSRPNTGTVIAVGPGRFSAQGQREPVDVTVGDHVVWKDDFGVESIDAKLTDGQGQLLAMKAFNIVAKW